MSLILILLLINALFFSFWYAFGGRDWVRKLITNAIGNMISAEISLGDLHLSDKQIYVQDIHFATSDSLLDLRIDHISIRYNLYKFLFSRFNPQGVVGSIEINHPVAVLSYRVLGKAPKARRDKGKFEIPDLSGYFRRINLIDGEIKADVAIPLKIMNEGDLYIEESLSDINLIVNNAKVTELSLKAITSRGGILDLSGRLDRGRIEIARAEITDFKPLYITHPDIRDFRSEINLSAQYSEAPDSSTAQYSGKALIWNSSALLFDDYPAQIPLIAAEADGRNLSARITRSRFGNSHVEGDIKIRDLGKTMSFDGSSLVADLDLSMIIPDLSGLVSTKVLASGSIKEPKIQAQIKSPKVAYQKWNLENIDINAEYSDDIARMHLQDASWENQMLELSAEFDPKLKALSANLNTIPISESGVDYYARGSAQIDGLLLAPFPLFEVQLSDFTMAYMNTRLDSINGKARMIPLSEKLLVDAQIDAGKDLQLSLIGDILDQHLLLDASFKDISVSGLYPQDTIKLLDPMLGGELHAMMLGRKIWTSSDLALKLQGDFPCVSNLEILGSGDLEQLSGSAFIRSRDSYYNDLPLDFELSASYAQNQLKVFGLKINDLLNLSGRVNVTNWQDMDFDLAVQDLTTAKLSGYYPDLELMIPEFKSLSLFANYNRNQDRKVDAWLNIRQLDLLSVIPLDLDLKLSGEPEQMNMTGKISSQASRLIDFSGAASLLPRIDLAMEAVMKDLRMQDVLVQAMGEGSFTGKVGVQISDAGSPRRAIEFDGDVIAKDIRFGDFTINRAVLKVAQQSQALVVDSLFVVSEGLFTASAKGRLGYNALTNLFYDSADTLDVEVNGQLFPWLRSVTDYIVDSRGVSNIRLRVGNDEEQFIVHSGNLDIHRGYVLLKDQVEAMRNIEIKGFFDENRFVIQQGTFNMGNGSFYMNNVFEPEPTDHFTLGFLDLGYLRLMISEPGIQVTIPVVAPPQTLSNIALKGQNSRYATVRGPFDDMKIEAYVTASNLDILYPPGADNLLNLILSVRSSAKKPESDPLPLPFQLDLFVSIGENVRYVTYPTNLNLQPGGFLHLLYDGSAFIVKEVFITSEQGTVDFVGTVFQVDNIAISMIDQQDIMNVEGLFYKRTPDGSTVSLNVHSTPEFDKSLLDRLEITLTSDNPADINITHVLSRLRYNQSMDELSSDQKQNLLQDEALGLIGGNLNSTVLTPIFYPVENWIRRSLGLDSFSINAGFIQNLFTEYSSNPSELADLADLSNLGSDISRFSSSILLNNLSISMSKYLGYRFFVDYEFGLQEATDLQKKTRLMVSHDTSLRLVLPKQYRMGYTFRYEPGAAGVTHEVMIQRTLRFWGL